MENSDAVKRLIEATNLDGENVAGISGGGSSVLLYWLLGGISTLVLGITHV